MSRPKGSKNKNTILLQEQQNQINQQNQEYEKAMNTYDQYITTYVEGYITKMFDKGIIQVVEADTLKTWLANPDTYYNEIADLMAYYYISDGDIYQLYTLVNILPTLNYKINVFDTSKKYEKNLLLCNKMLKKINYKSLTRDLLSQEVSKGTVVSIWLGDKKNPYLFIFDELKYVFPKYRLNGDWVCVIDLEIFRDMKEEELNSYLLNLNPYITQSMVDLYKKNPCESKNRYIELPQDRTCCLRANTIVRNQRLGLPFGTQALFSKLHKQNLLNMETAIANKIIKNIAVLKIGSEKNPEYANAKLNPNLKRKIHAQVKKAMSENIQNGVAVIAVPEYVDLSFGEIQGLDGLKQDKFESVNNDIDSSLGASKSLTSGNGGNYANGKLNLDILYKRIGVLLEDIENNVYSKLFKLILSSNVSDDYGLEFDKEVPLSNLDKINTLIKLHSEGFAVKPIIDSISGLNYQEYIDQSFYEIDDLQLRTRIIPPMLSYTTSGTDTSSSDVGGAPTVTDPTNDSTIADKTSGGNITPRAGI